MSSTIVTVIVIIVLLIVFVGAGGLVVAGIRRSKVDEDPLSARLIEFSQRGEAASLEEIELSQPFVDRVIYPMMVKIGEMSSKITPQHVIEQTARNLELAGNPGRMEATAFLSLRIILMGVLGGLFLLISLVSSTWPPGREFLVTIVLAALGYFLPALWLRSKIDRRQRSIRKAMPDALDLLTICVEAGLGLDAAMSKINEKWENDLALAFGRTIREIQLGKLRREALKDMSDRVGIPEMTSFIAAVIQSEQLGVSMAKVLRIQSDQMRMKRRQRAEEEAHKAPIKMLLPMGVFIFPTIMIVLLTPAGLRLWKTFSGLGF
ncbi:MAG: type II secretion system F family protein [Anaerolineales bacterium]|nr:type II secretion system F family protein [Anaerolineales bacterium]